MDLILSMRVFHKVADNLSFKAAAEHFNFSPTAVSKHIAHLESHLNAKLLSRTTRKVQLTEIGKQYLSRSQKILSDISETESFIRESAGTPMGLLKIGCPVGFGIKILAPLIVEFQKQYPKVKIEVSFSDRIEDPMETGFDLTVRITRELKDSSLVAVKLADIESVIVASPKYLKQHSSPKKPEDLKSHNVLLYSHSTSPNTIRLSKAKKDYEILVSGTFITNNTFSLLPQLLADRGIAQLPKFYVHDLIESGKLQKLLPNFSSPTFSL